MSIDDAIRRFAGEYGQRPSGAGKRPLGVALLFGTITTVTAGGSTDGLALVTVTLNNGSVTAAPYDLAYASPTVGQYVAVLVVNSQPFILGRAGGFPPT
jgi:hypothetical protein